MFKIKDLLIFIAFVIVSVICFVNYFLSKNAIPQDSVKTIIFLVLAAISFILACVGLYKMMFASKNEEA